MKEHQGHWVLAKLGKKVLRPGGKKLTSWLIDTANPTGKRVVEFAPGLGITAKEILDRNPLTYVGVDADAHAVATTSTQLAGDARVIQGTADNTGLDDASCDLIVGEAMLTMQGEKGKKAIIAEAHRILDNGGSYAIHELALTPNNVDVRIADALRKALARAIKVIARPPTAIEWSTLLEEAGFQVVSTKLAPMGLLNPRQMLDDEGPRVFKILFNLLRYPDARKRVLAMRKVFKDNTENLGSIAIVAKKL